MSKLSSKLSAGVRKVKGQDDKPAAAQPETAQPVARKTAPTPAPATMPPARVWPD